MKRKYEEDLTSGGSDYVLTAKGDSMINAGIHDGDIVFVKEQPEVENGQIAVVAIGDESTLKRVYYYRDKALLILRAENPDFPDIVKTNEELNEVRIIGRAVSYLASIK